MKIERERILMQAINVATAVFIISFIVVLFLWFLPFLTGSKFMVYEKLYDERVFRWFASNVSQIERDAFMAYIIFGFPLMIVFSYFALTGAEARGNA